MLRSNGAVVVVPLAVEDLEGVTQEHRLVAPEGYLEVHGVGEDDEGLSLALGLGVRTGIENDDVEDDEALEEGHHVLEVDVVRDAPDADAGEGTEDVFEGVHGRADTYNADVGVATVAASWLTGSASLLGGLLLSAGGVLVKQLGLMRNQILRSRGEKVLQMSRNAQVIAAGEFLQTGSWLLLLLRLLLTNEMRLLRWYSLVYRRSTRR